LGFDFPIDVIPDVISDIPINFSIDVNINVISGVNPDVSEVAS